jgi:hypothetical protein
VFINCKEIAGPGHINSRELKFGQTYLILMYTFRSPRLLFTYEKLKYPPNSTTHDVKQLVLIIYSLYNYLKCFLISNYSYL